MEVIEIPFGAKDSELQEWTYTIPKGMKAEIRDDKVIIKKKESEGERIRKAIIESLPKYGYLPQTSIKVEDAIAWLEKQKEQKSVECIKFDNEFENQISHLIASVLNGEHEYNEGFVKYVAQSLLGYARKEQKPLEYLPKEKVYDIIDKLTDLSYSKLIPFKSRESQKIDEISTDILGLLNYPIKQKPEWSEEDKHRCGDAIYFLETAKKHYADTSEIELTIEWLKSLRPQSKDEIYKEKNEKPKHTEVWVEGRTIFEQDAN